jgi:hypothetical protein
MISNHPQGKVAAALAVFTLTVGLSAYAQTPATLPPMLPTSMTAGLIDPAGKVPTINGVPGSQVTNLDVSFPLALLAHSAKITTFKTAPPDIWLWVATGKAIPNSPGLATLTGSFKCGTTTSSIKSTVLLQ